MGELIPPTQSPPIFSNPLQTEQALKGKADVEICSMSYVLKCTMYNVNKEDFVFMYIKTGLPDKQQESWSTIIFSFNVQKGVEILKRF